MGDIVNVCKDMRAIDFKILARNSDKLQVLSYHIRLHRASPLLASWKAQKWDQGVPANLQWISATSGNPLAAGNPHSKTDYSSE
jgi:hypothetical protein